MSIPERKTNSDSQLARSLGMLEQPQRVLIHTSTRGMFFDWTPTYVAEYH